MRDGERQVAPLIKDIRRDHVARYEFAARELPKGVRVVDLACGVGYGTWILASTGHPTLGLDVDGEALAYAAQHYPHKQARYGRCDADHAAHFEQRDAAVCFETIEHVADPRPLLKALHAAVPLLLASVPNEDVMPFGAGYAFHHRHYTQSQFAELLDECGWRVEKWHGQLGPESEVGDELGRTIIAIARRKTVRKPSGRDAMFAAADRLKTAYANGAEYVAPLPKIDIDAFADEFMKDWPVAGGRPATPEHVAILGLGPSLDQYTNITKRLGGRRKFCDETWGINALGDIIACDRVFHMDDVRIQEIRARAAPESNIAGMLQWMRTAPGPIYTSRKHEGYPGLVDFPLEEVINSTGYAYMNNTAAYAIALAVHLGVKKLSLFGVDFTYPNAHDAEKGRACCEFWLGIAAARGIKLAMPRESSLMDALAPFAERLYGYDTVKVDLVNRAGGGFTVEYTPRETLPTAAEIEARYDHSKHPSALVENAQAFRAAPETK
jgi:hypothetical protein